MTMTISGEDEAQLQYCRRKLAWTWRHDKRNFYKMTHRRKSFKWMDRASVISGRTSVQSGYQQERRWGGRRHAWRIRKISKWIETINKQHHWILSTSNAKKMVPVIITLPQDSGKEENLKSLGSTLRMRIESRLLSSRWHSDILKVLKE